jgi:hypothetical protein
MTAWKDEPPLTRRQIRMNERQQRAEGGPDLPRDEAVGEDAPVTSGGLEDHDRPLAAVPNEPARSVFRSDPARSKVPSYSGPSFRNSATGEGSQAGARSPLSDWQAAALPGGSAVPKGSAHPVEPQAAVDDAAGLAVVEQLHIHDETEGEHQLTRRELRALRAESGGQQAPELRVPTTAAAEAAAQPAQPGWPLAQHPEVVAEEPVSADFAQIITAPPIDAAPEATPAAYPEFPIDGGGLQPEPIPVVPRDLSSTGAITANVLVLPSMPNSGKPMRPINDGGEILITGSVELPASLGATGSYPTHYDHSDVDVLIEADDREDTAANSAPVRAVRAISTHAATPGMVVGRMPRQSRFPLVLVVVAAAMAVGVVVLVVAGFIFKVF